MTGWDLLSELAELADNDCDALNQEIYLGVITQSRSDYGVCENFKICSDNGTTRATIFLTTKENTQC